MFVETFSRAKYYLYYLGDLLNAPRVDPVNTLVISGFWRSGTTWLQELLAGWLNAKTIFEPFHLSVPGTERLFQQASIEDRSPNFRERFIPAWNGEPMAANELLAGWYERALRGTTRGRAVRVLRRGPADAFRTRMVLKLTRGQLSLAAAQARFGFPLLHVVRDPRAVIASIRMTDWAYMFDDLDVAEMLAGSTAHRRLAGRWGAEIRAAEGKDPAVRIATYWAVLESAVLDSALQRERSARVRYADVVRDPEPILRTVLEQIGVVPPAGAASRGRASYSTSEGRQDLSVEERLFSWKKILAPAECASIEAVAERFGLADTLRSDAG